MSKIPAGICDKFPNAACSKSASFYSTLKPENLLQALAYWKALTSACRIRITTDETFDIEAFNQKLKRALESRDSLACLEAEREFNRHHKTPMLFGYTCIHEREHIASELKARLGTKGFNHPMIKVLRGDSKLEEAILSTPVMRGPGKSMKSLDWIIRDNVLKRPGQLTGNDQSYSDDFKADAFADAMEIHGLFQKGVRKYLQMGDMPIGSILGDGNIVLRFLEKGILPDTNKPILIIPSGAGFKLDDNILWNREQLRSLFYLQLLLETLLPILLEQKKHGLSQMIYDKMRYRIKKWQEEESHLEQLMEHREYDESEGEYSETGRVAKQIARESLINESQSDDVTAKIGRILRQAERYLSPEGFKALQLYSEGYTQEEAAKLAGITDRTFRNYLAKLKKL